MPELVRFSGIRLCMYFGDHLPPHFHVEYGEYKALIGIQDGALIRGKFPRRKLQEVQTYLAENRESLLETFFEFNPNLSNK